MITFACVATPLRPTAALAAPIPIDGAASHFAVRAEDVRILEAPASEDDLRVLALPDTRFSRLGRAGFDLGYPSGALFLALDVHNPTAHDVTSFLVVPSPFTDDVRCIHREGGRVRVDRAGDQFPHARFAMHATFPVFPLRIAPHATERVVIAIRSQSQVRVPLHFVDLDTLVAAQGRVALGAGMLVVILLVLAVFNAYLLAIVRELGFAWLVVHLLSTALYCAALSGLGQAYVWPNAWNASNLCAVSGAALSSASLLAFLRYALSTRENTPRIDRVLHVLTYAMALIVIVAFVDYRSASLFGFMALAVVPFIALPAAVVRTQRDHGSTRYVTAAVALLAVSHAAYSLTMAFVRGISFSSALAVSMLPVVSAAIAGVLFSLGVFERMRFVDAERALLKASEARLARMASRSSDVLFDVPRWVEQSLADLHEALGSVKLSVYEMTEGGAISQLPGREGEIPPVASLLAPDDTNEGLDVRVLRGSDGGVLGVVTGMRAMHGADAKMVSLLEGFLQQLEIALELRRSHVRLRASESRSGELRAALERDGASPARLCTACKTVAGPPLERCPACGHALRELEGVPAVVRGRYVLCRALGSGGMGHVFEARDSKLDCSVALKLVRTEHLSDPELRERFELEGRALSRIHHENVVRVLDAGSAEGGGLYLAMEFLQGRTLTRCVRTGGRGRPRDVARFVRQAARALASVHGSGIVHRDVKPENFHLVPTGGTFTVKLLDFGVVRRLSDGSGLTRTGILVGTPRYMAPEQIATGMASTATDVFALALVVGECIVGRPLVRDPSMPLVERMKLGDPSELAFVTDDPALASLLAEALAPTAERRPVDVVAWAESVATVLEKQPDAGASWVIDDDAVFTDEALQRSVAPTLPTLRSPGPGAMLGDDDTPI